MLPVSAHKPGRATQHRPNPIPCPLSLRDNRRGVEHENPSSRSVSQACLHPLPSMILIPHRNDDCLPKSNPRFSQADNLKVCRWVFLIIDLGNNEQMPISMKTVRQFVEGFLGLDSIRRPKLRQRGSGSTRPRARTRSSIFVLTKEPKSVKISTRSFSKPTKMLKTRKSRGRRRQTVIEFWPSA